MSEKRGLGEHFEKRGLRSFRRINTYRVDRNLVLYQARGGAHRRKLVRGLPFRNKLDGGKPSWIWGQKMRNRPQCRVTTPRGRNSDQKLSSNGLDIVELEPKPVDHRQNRIHPALTIPNRICLTSAKQGRFLKVCKSAKRAPILDLCLGRLW